MRILVIGGAADRAAELLRWQPRHGPTDEIIGSARAWRRANPAGYAGRRS